MFEHGLDTPRKKRKDTDVLSFADARKSSGFYFAGPIINQSEIPTNYYAVQKGDRFFAVKRRGGENPPAFEIAENQYRLWKQGEVIHAVSRRGLFVLPGRLGDFRRHAAACRGPAQLKSPVLKS
jgi:hypothetical protein